MAKNYSPRGANRRRAVRQAIRKALASGDVPYVGAGGKPCLDLYFRGGKQHFVIDRLDLPKQA